MSDWAGFTEEELRRLKHQQYGNAGVEERTHETVTKKSNLNSGARKSRPREKLRTKRENHKTKNANEVAKNERKTENTRNSIENVICEKSESALPRSLERENSSPECERATRGAPQEEKEAIEEKKKESQKEEETPEPEMILEPEKIQAIELSALERLQQQQKEIEEQNKRKKAALQETIRKRYRKTQAEAQTLNLVQKELAHLDSLLSTDVSILRDKIEEATRDYCQAQKRYVKAEAEFVAAKLDLHRKTERKELLTEHLYSIIQENEQRKAKKLEELMAKLDVSEDMVVVHEEIPVSKSTASVEEKTELKVDIAIDSKDSDNATAETKVVSETAIDESSTNQTPERQEEGSSSVMC